MSYPRHEDKRDHHLAILGFSDAGRSSDNGQISYSADIVVDDMKFGSIYHVLYWSSHQGNSPFWYIDAAEILAAVEAIDEWKFLARTVSNIFDVDLPLYIALESKYLITSLSTQRN